MQRPKRIWWARPRKLCALERPGGGGRSHRPDRREEEIEYLTERGVWLVISTMPTRHNLETYERAGLEWQAVARFGPDYARTLQEWAERFQYAWRDITPLGFDERFRRLPAVAH